MRQYRIITKTPDTPQVQLKPGLHAGLYNIPEIRKVIEFVQDNTNVEMVGLRIGSRLYSVVVVEHDALQDDHFQLQDIQVD